MKSYEFTITLAHSQVKLTVDGDPIKAAQDFALKGCHLPDIQVWYPPHRILSVRWREIREEHTT